MGELVNFVFGAMCAIYGLNYVVKILAWIFL